MSLFVISDDGPMVRLQALGCVTAKDPTSDRDPLCTLLGDDGFSRNVALDMSQTEFIDSAGIGWLLACHKRFQRAGGMLVLHSVPAQFELTLKLLKLHKIFCLAENLRAAELLAPPSVTQAESAD